MALERIDGYHRMRKIRQLARPLPESTMEARLNEIIRIAKGEKEKPAKTERKSKSLYNRKEEGGLDRSE